MVRSSLTSFRLRESRGSWKSPFPLRQSSAGKPAIRWEVIAPVNSPEAIGE
jgi:hypothetical protein